MLPICLFLRKKQNKTTTKKRKKFHPAEVEPETFDVERERIIYCATQTIAKDWMSNLTLLCPQDKFFIQDGAENADI